ncbi:uncharacterized protein [Miscanthus floridulus]|uniref:uncharacterized protein n=1 Tax=Miscanthus floridulus TaxID=154761 RepID=UPI0034587B13
MFLWDAIEDAKVERRRDRLALGAMLRGVPTEMHSMLLKKKNAKEAWDALKIMRLGADRVKEANAQRLLTEFEQITFKPGEAIDEFAMRILKLATDLEGLGEKIDDSRVVKKFLRVVPARYNQVAVAIEMFCDMSTLSIEELVGRLRVAEDYFEPSVEQVTEKMPKLLLTEEEWLAKNKSRMVQESSSSSGHRSGDSRYVRKDRSRARGGGDARDSGAKLTSMGTPRRKGRCNKCKIYGHFARECKTKPKEEKQEAAHHVAGDPEMGALLVAQAAQQQIGVQIRAVRRNRLYVMKPNLTVPVCLLSKMEEMAWLWHARYGHLNFRALKDLASKQMVEGLPQIHGVEQVCDGCVLGMHHRRPFPQVSTYRAEGGLELVHGDLCGQITPPTLGGKSYFLLIVDDFSRFMWLELLSTKDEALVYFKKIVLAAEVESGCQLKAFRTDCGGEFNSRAFMTYCSDRGVKHNTTTPYTPQQNGVVERQNQSVVEMARCLLKAMKVPAKFWGEAVKTAVYLLNRAPTKT